MLKLFFASYVLFACNETEPNWGSKFPQTYNMTTPCVTLLLIGYFPHMDDGTNPNQESSIVTTAVIGLFLTLM